jgi:hypothetical protein
VKGCCAKALAFGAGGRRRIRKGEGGYAGGGSPIRAAQMGTTIGQWLQGATWPSLEIGEGQ